MTVLGLNAAIISSAINYVHQIFDELDAPLTNRNQPRLSKKIELNNLSSMLGNFFRSGIEEASKGNFQSNKPHTYPDLLGTGNGCRDLEIKVALEKYHPKGHHVKPGAYLIVRYVLGGPDGSFDRKSRGDVVWIWDVRIGQLVDEHFSFSSTEGDSGKTATIKAAGLAALTPIYFDEDRCPYKNTSPHRRNLREVFSEGR
jgi:hypothetical protein